MGQTEKEQNHEKVEKLTEDKTSEIDIVFVVNVLGEESYQLQSLLLCIINISVKNDLSLI